MQGVSNDNIVLIIRERVKNMRDDYLDKLREFIFKQDHKNWQKLDFKKGQQIYLSDVHLIVSGEVEIFILGENGEAIKLRNLGPEDVLISLDGYFGVEKFSAFYRIKSETSLIKIPCEAIEKLFNNTYFSNCISKLIFHRMTEVGFSLLLRSNASNKGLIKHLLVNECRDDSTLKINNVLDFVDKYNINRSTFYKGLKKLEESGEIKKEGKKIKLLK